MRVSRHCIFLFLFTSILTLATQAQQVMKSASVPSNETASAGKIALVDTRFFYDQKAGIQKLINAYKQLETEFAPRQADLQRMQDRIQAMNTEINKMGATPAARAKEEELVRLQREFDTKRMEAEAAVNRRRVMLVEPIQQHIGKALQDFIITRGITLLLDASKLEGAILAALPTIDVTQAFIADYNLKHPGSANAANR